LIEFYVLPCAFIFNLKPTAICFTVTGKFILGVALLIGGGEGDKAYDLVVQAAEGVSTDHFMASALLQHSSKPQKGLYPNLKKEMENAGSKDFAGNFSVEEEQLSNARLLVLYYLQVREDCLCLPFI
jgi:hypothetical protein